MRHFVCIHGHFYQPPRENPWTGVIERQPSAGETHDWNVRIARECYIPNGRARVVNERNEPIAEVNNYSWLNFNFGGTLLSWYEKAYPDEYRRLLEADRESAERLEGHGNAIAQAYNHMIMPLANVRDQATQVRWGIADFKHRFGRSPEALWLPETACDDVVLRLLIEHGLKYAILAPHQARRVRRLRAGEKPDLDKEWMEIKDENIDTRHAYRWFDRRPRQQGKIDIFFYNGSLARAVAFEKLMAHSPAAAQRILSVFDAHLRSAQLVSIATDGETYGHHEPFADMGLAHLFKYELPKQGMPVVNFGYYLAKHKPICEVEIQPGLQGFGTSWSCAHGVGRWLEDCGCGAENGKHQKWRKPMREALDWLRDRLILVFEQKGSAVLRDVWKARDGYIQVILNPDERSTSFFLARHLRGPCSPQARRKALALLEMQKFAMFMYTSCGWFFAEISGLEAMQNLKYAARAMELARESGGPDLEPEFLRLLKAAPSNVPEFEDGEGVYLKLVRPATASSARA
ncbi:MAG: hypothetical protein A3J74_06310 [Elusimicrobia bacterium RIFCSPHIGHO2_02_FULL_57_9]|nr:MAG: hypothetical protein A3J74_06310 [Elusimicrobia bacterium RIFCSPHIGHO2_02_FULL_57_9]